MRGKFRNSFEKPEPFSPGQPVPVRFTMQDVCHTFRPGHRLMVQVQSTWFPLVDRNPQTFVDIYTAKESDFRKAVQRVYRSVRPRVAPDRFGAAIETGELCPPYGRRPSQILDSPSPVRTWTTGRGGQKVPGPGRRHFFETKQLIIHYGLCKVMSGARRRQKAPGTRLLVLPDPLTTREEANSGPGAAPPGAQTRHKRPAQGVVPAIAGANTSLRLRRRRFWLSESCCARTQARLPRA